MAFILAWYGEMMREEQAQTDRGGQTAEEFGAMATAGLGVVEVPPGKRGDRGREVFRDMDDEDVG